METITEDAQGRKDFEFCNNQIAKYNVKKDKKDKGEEQTGATSKELEKIKADN